MELLNIGQKLSIYFEKNGKLVEMSSSIEEIFDDRLALALPPYFMRYIDCLEVGRRLTIKIFSKVGTLDFNGVVISSPLEDSFKVELDYNAIRLTPSEEIPVISAVETLNIGIGEENIKARTFQITTTYFKIYSDYKFKVGDFLDCALVLPKNYGTIYFKATVTDVDTVYENEYTISDFCMTEGDRQQLLYYMYIYTNDSDWDEE